MKNYAKRFFSSDRAIILRPFLRTIRLLQPEARFWAPLFTAIGTVLATWFQLRAAVQSYWIFILAPVIASLLFVLLDNITIYIKSKFKWRIILEKPSKFEGVWLEFYFPETLKLKETIGDDIEDGKNRQFDPNTIMYAGFSINYTGDKDEPYEIKGDAYYNNGKSFAEWRSTRIKFNSESNRLEYFYTGRFFDLQYEVKGFGYFSFNVTPIYISKLTRRESERRPHSGSGYFIDNSASGAVRSSVQFIRITSNLMKDVLGEEINISEFSLERNFIIRFHEKYGEKIAKHGFFSLDNLV